MRIDCPRCGSRDVHEWRFGGELPHRDPKLGADEADIVRVWMRENRDGQATERWFHEAGCRRWCTVVRDTVTGEVVSVAR